jgi:acyl-CoA thioesterase-1
MGHQNHREALFLIKFPEQVKNRLTRLRVQIPGGFIGKKHIGGERERPRNGNSLLLTTGEFAWPVCQSLGQSHPLEDTFRCLLGFHQGLPAD